MVASWELVTLEASESCSVSCWRRSCSSRLAAISSALAASATRAASSTALLAAEATSLHVRCNMRNGRRGHNTRVDIQGWNAGRRCTSAVENPHCHILACRHSQVSGLNDPGMQVTGMFSCSSSILLLRMARPCSCLCKLLAAAQRLPELVFNESSIKFGQGKVLLCMPS